MLQSVLCTTVFTNDTRGTLAKNICPRQMDLTLTHSSLISACIYVQEAGDCAMIRECTRIHDKRKYIP